MSKLYSVIVPVYNSEKVIGRCIESILCQTLDDFELILVDDGSTDSSGEICDHYKEKDQRIKVIHIKNSGVSAARNIGINHAIGKYIVFVDSDDYVSKLHLEALGKGKEELVITGLRTYGINNEIKFESAEKETAIDLNSQKEIIQFLKQWYSIQVWNKRFDKEIIEKWKLRFDENIQYGEDTIFLAEYLKHIQRVRIIDKITYNWCEYESPTLSKISEVDWIKSNDILQEKLYKIFNEYEEVRKFIIDRYWWDTENKINTICNKKEGVKYIKREIETVLTGSFFQFCIRNDRRIPIGYVLRFCFKKKWTWGVIIKYRRG